MLDSIAKAAAFAFADPPPDAIVGDEPADMANDRPAPHAALLSLWRVSNACQPLREAISIISSSVSSIRPRSEEHTSELQSLMRISYAVFCLNKKNKNTNINNPSQHNIQ